MAWEDDTKILIRSPYLLHCVSLAALYFGIRMYGVHGLRKIMGVSE